MEPTSGKSLSILSINIHFKTLLQTKNIRNQKLRTGPSYRNPTLESKAMQKLAWLT